MVIKKYIWDNMITDTLKSHYLYYVRSSSLRKAYAEERNELNKNLEYKNIYKGKRVFIIGNGPSLKKQDLSCLRNEYVMTVNYANRLEQFDTLNTNFHFFMDGIAIKHVEDNETNKQNFDKMLDIQRKGNVNPVIFLNIQAMPYVKRYGLNEKYTIRYMHPSLPVDVDFKLPADLTKYVPGNFTTVVQWGIYAAIYMGFSEIYLLGCDCTNIINILNERAGIDVDNSYGYSQSNEEKTMQKQTNSYASVEQYLQNAYKMFEIYGKQYKLCQKNNIKLVNCTAGGILDNIPRMRYEDVIIKYIEQ